VQQLKFSLWRFAEEHLLTLCMTERQPVNERVTATKLFVAHSLYAGCTRWCKRKKVHGASPVREVVLKGIQLQMVFSDCEAIINAVAIVRLQAL
jgi:hypothetical protein